MAVERIVIEITGDTSKIKSTIAELEKLGKVDRDNADSFNKNNKKFNDNLNSTKDNLGSFGDQLNSLKQQVIGAFAISSLIAFGKEAVQTSAKIESIGNSLKFITGSATGAQRTMEYLRDLSNRLGLEFESTAQAFKLFAGAATQSGLSLRKSKTIFEQVSKAVTTMGLSADDAQGVFLAMSQILSKGTVSAEELRGQIGERLPGAFAIAAKSIGVTERQLNKMLEQGQVLSNDFLPKFANQLEKDLGGGAEAAANSTQAALNRLTNSWSDFKNWFGATIVAPIVQGAADIVKAMNGANPQAKARATAMAELQKEFDGYIKKIEELDTAEGKYLKAGDMIAKMEEKKKMAAKEAAGARVVLQDEVDKLFTKTGKLVLMRQFQEKGEDAYLTALSISGNKRIRALVDLIRLNDEYGKGYDDLIPKLQDYSESILNESKVINENTESKKKKGKEDKKELTAYEKLVKSASDAEKALQDLYASGVLANTPLEIKLRTVLAQIDMINERVRQAKEGFDKMETTSGTEKGGTPKAFTEAITAFGKPSQNKLAIDQIVENAKKANDEFDKIEEERTKKFKEEQEKRKSAEEEFYNKLPQFASQAISIISQYQNQAAEYELQVLNEKLAAKQISDKEYEKERRKILTKQAQDQKAAAILQATIDIAGSIMSTLKQFGGTPYGIAMAAITAGLGAAQLAVIQSQKIPKFKKGTDYVSLNGNPKGEDTIPALLNEGEAIIRTEENAKYPGLAKAWNDGKLDEHIYSKWITPELILKKSIEREAIDYDKLGQSVADSIKKNPQVKVSFDKSGFATYIIKGSSVINYQNNRYSSK